jgi:Icc-related predicted phosphoesterase
VAAAADIHAGVDSVGAFGPHLETLSEHADVLLLAGDLTKCGSPEEAAVMARELRGCPVPIVAVLGNHDYHAGEEKNVVSMLEDAGARVLEGDRTVIDVDGERLGIAGTKGFGGGFAGACASDFGEPEMKSFIRHTESLARRLEESLEDIQDVDARVVLLHYAPVRDTLAGEKPEIYPFLGSFLLAEAIDRAGADLVVHGHAHAGTEKGVTPAGIHVRNVAQPVIKHAYNLYSVGRTERAPVLEAMTG